VSLLKYGDVPDVLRGFVYFPYKRAILKQTHMVLHIYTAHGSAW